MVNERAIAICIPRQKRRPLQTRGIRMPSGKNNMTLPLAFRTQNARAVEPFGSLIVADGVFSLSPPRLANPLRRAQLLGADADPSDRSACDRSISHTARSRCENCC